MSEREAVPRPSARKGIPIKPARTGVPLDDMPPPIEGYDQMTAIQIIRMLPRLSPAELEEFIEYETAHACRQSVMHEFRRYRK